MKKSMRIRIFLGTVMILVLSGLLVLDWWLEQIRPQVVAGWLMAAIVLPMGVLAFGELSRLAGGAGVRLMPASGYAGVLLIGFIPFFRQLYGGGSGAWTLPVCSLVLMGIFAEQMIRRRALGVFQQVGATVLGVLYVGLGISLLMAIRLDFGIPALTVFLAGVKFTDIGAYFTGSAWGRHKMVPWLSPGKSWQGLAGGLAAGMAACVLFGTVLGLPLGIWQLLILGVLLATAGQFGDLCESLLKRSATFKDSADMLPEFGGLLDVIDSPLMAAGVGYVMLSLLWGAS